MLDNFLALLYLIFKHISPLFIFPSRLNFCMFSDNWSVDFIEFPNFYVLLVCYHLLLQFPSSANIILKVNHYISLNLFRIIRSYLLHYGYQDTLDSFDAESESIYPRVTRENGIEEEGHAYALKHRKILRQVRGC